jgi:hypothetical protein
MEQGVCGPDKKRGPRRCFLASLSLSLKSGSFNGPALPGLPRLRRPDGLNCLGIETTFEQNPRKTRQTTHTEF